MLGIGFPELIVICIVALIFIGPKKLPDLMRQGGRLFVQLRRTANDVKSSFEQVVHEAEEEMRRAETEALREAILADHVKAKNLLTSSEAFDPNPQHQNHTTEHMPNESLEGSDVPHQPEGAEPFNPSSKPTTDDLKQQTSIEPTSESIESTHRNQNKSE